MPTRVTPQRAEGQSACGAFTFLFGYFGAVGIFHCENIALGLFPSVHMALKSRFSPQILQVALRSCVCQLQAQRPQEKVSLPWVHIAYQHFRSRLQNFSRILTICPQILQMLLYNIMGTTRNDRLDGPELVWPLLGRCVHGQGLAFIGRTEGGQRTGAGGAWVAGGGRAEGASTAARDG